MPNLDSITATGISLPEDQPLRRAVRRLRWFRSTFDAQLAAIEKQTGIAYHLDTPKLTRSFIHWLHAFEAQKPEAIGQRQAYVGFAAGLMLRHLITGRPLAVDALPDPADRELPAYFWPEGYAYVMYCLNVRTAVIMEEFKQETPLSPAVGEIRAWQSFKENVEEDPSRAIAFLDLFAGVEPDWSMPNLFKGNAENAAAIASFDLKVLDGGKSDPFRA